MKPSNVIFTLLAIGSLQTEADTLVKEIVPAIQQEAAKFAQAVVQLNNATSTINYFLKIF